MEMRAPERCPAKASRLRAEPRDWRPLTQRGGGGGGQAASLLGKLAPAGTLEPRAGPCGALCASPAAWLWSPPLQGPSHVTSLSRPRQDPPQREDGKGVLPEPSWNSERDQGPRGGCESCRRRFSGFSEKTRRCNLGRQDTWRMANGAKRRILDDGRAGVYGA